MIIVKLLGGLGNQMFQYAMARKVALDNNTELKFDIFGFNENSDNTKREYELYLFKIKADFATSREIKNFSKYKIKPKKRIENYLYNTFIADQFKYFQQANFGYDPRVKKLKDNVYISGQWSSEKYFINIKDALLKEFTLKDKYLNKINSNILNLVKKTSSISLHIRRGDYVSDEKTKIYHGLIPINYYLQAEKYIRNKVKNPVFFIFSDDINWVKNNLKLKSKSYYVSNYYSNKDFEDLEIMKNCKHNIIANSTFSWWAAWLNININKIVITPKHWFTKERKLWDLLPESWIKI